MGKGIGFGKKVSEHVEPGEDARIYTLQASGERGQAGEIVKSIDPEFLEIANLVLDEAQKVFGNMKELSMHYSFRNTLCGLAVVIAAGLLADQAAAQTVTLLEDDDTISLSPADEGSSAPEEISLFDEQMGDVSLPGGDGLLSPSQPTDSVATDVIPMEGSTDDNSSEQISIAVENETAPAQNAPAGSDGLNMTIEGEAPAVKTVSDTPPTAVPTVTGKLLGAEATGGFDENISPSISNDLFTKMSDLEKQTTLH